ncbi:MAG TPA: DUF1501 domain-containing protein [Anaerolineaceae bacterium]|nr:DUF1501 domain-containing protein [Anaerolineaceae bacterium]
MELTRRQLLQGCSLSIASLAGARLTRVAFTAAESPADLLVVVFLRGGWDALNVVTPLDGNDRAFYQQARPNIQIPAGRLLPVDDQFGFHPALAALRELYQDSKLAIIHAAGLTENTRSHFDAMEYIELGTPGRKSTTSGWITRHLQSAPYGIEGLLPVIAAGDQPSSLLNYSAAVRMSTPEDFSAWDYGLEEPRRAALRRLYQGQSLLHQVGQRTLDTLQVVAPLQNNDYQPANGATYSDNDLGRQLKTVARMVKLQAGLQVATVDFGGWDTHEYQNNENGEGYLQEMLGELSNELANFYLDLDGTGSQDYASRLSVIVLSEFGRRLAQNDSYGTDHGHGSVMLALGGGVNGGKVFGEWPGLSNEQLYDRADLAVTTDFRQVLGELLVKRLANPDLETVFPGFSAGYQPLGIFRA